MNIQPLKIPAGWSVEWNLLTETDPTEETIHEFSGSLLLINSPTRLKAIDVCWKPEGDVNGFYQLQVIPLLPNFVSKTNEMEYEGLWDSPEVEFKTKNRLELVDKINDLLFHLKPYVDKRILLEPGIVDLPNEAIRQQLMDQGPTENIIRDIINSNHKKLQGLLLDCAEIQKHTVQELEKNGASKGVKNKAKQMLLSKRFRE